MKYYLFFLISSLYIINFKFKPLFEKISNAINVVSERENFTHVFSAGVPGVDVLLYAKPTDDISNLVLAELGIDPPSPNN